MTYEFIEQRDKNIATQEHREIARSWEECKFDKEKKAPASSSFLCHTVYFFRPFNDIQSKL